MADFWNSVLSRAAQLAVFSPRVEYLGGGPEELVDYYRGAHDSVSSATPAYLWRSQPHLRTVVSFLARNVAQLGVHSFERVDETDRKRDRTSVLARALGGPDVGMTTYDLIFATIGDMCLYDRAYWYVGPSERTRSGYMLRRLPPSWVTPRTGGDVFEVVEYIVSLDGQKSVSVPAENILDFSGYSPTSPINGSPTVEALRDTLQEQIEAAVYRRQVWKRGGRVSSVLQRPADAAKWSDHAREAFRQDWYAKYTGRGAGAGGTPILEDGMTIQRIDFNAQEQQFVEAAKLSLVTVAAGFHVNPTMIGQNDGANYSNVREFRRMLYGDTLGPLLAQVEARLNTFLIPMLGMDPERYYVEFNIAEKLQGSFEEQSAAMSRAVGGPWMLRSEARAVMNLPSIDGADELIVPLNVVEGGQASPADSGSQNETGDLEKALAVVNRQQQVVKSRLGAKRADWWTPSRWDTEMSEALGDPASARELNQATKRALDLLLRAKATDLSVAFDAARHQLIENLERAS